MPGISTFQIRGVSRLWNGRCPVRGCQQGFHIEAAPWQAKIDVLEAFRFVRPGGRHVHGSFFVNAHQERGGE